MTENEYFLALDALLHTQLIDAMNRRGTGYTIKENTQTSFDLIVSGLKTHRGIKPDSVTTQWHCFSSTHPYAQLRADRVVISWSHKRSGPEYLMVELKSTNTGSAHKQLGATLAFCHFVHQMVCVGHPSPPIPKFAGVTVSAAPFALKMSSTPVLPKWSPQGIGPDCKHMHFPRSRGALPVHAVLAQV